MKRFFLLVTVLLFAININSFADRRYFGRSYTSYTLPKGAFELEIWNTGRIGKDAGFYYRWQPRAEFEYGVTDRFTASLYFNFNEVRSKDNSYPSKGFSLSTTSLEFRYRLTNPNEIFIDPALYFEFAYGGDKIVYEPKLLLSKRFDNFIAVANVVSEIERYVADNKTESKFELTSGLLYEVTPSFGLGVEFRNHRNFENIYEKSKNEATFVGPTINFQTESFYLTFNFLHQIAGSPSTGQNLDLKGHEKYEVRTILGVEL